MKIDYVVNELKQDIVVPKVVQEKAEDAFAQIRREAEREQHDKKVIRFCRNRKTVFGRSRAAAAMLAVLVCASAVTVSAAAYRMWSSSLKETLHVTEQQQKDLEENTVSAYPMQSSEDAGVTVTSVQSIADNQYAYLAFKVEGYDFSKNDESAFDKVWALIDGKDTNIYGGSFAGDEYCMVISPAKQLDTVIGKEIRVGFSGLGSCEKAGVNMEIDGVWELSWTLQGSDDLAAYDLTEAIGDSGVILTRAEISPISLNITCTMPRTTIKVPYVDETNQQEGMTEMYREPPRLVGVKMKDGSLCADIRNGGREGYTDDESDIYHVSVITNRILNAAEVEALLFLKDNIAGVGDDPLSEDTFYVVPVH